jgi:hypothetical protein
MSRLFREETNLDVKNVTGIGEFPNKNSFNTVAKVLTISDLTFKYKNRDHIRRVYPLTDA